MKNSPNFKTTSKRSPQWFYFRNMNRQKQRLEAWLDRKENRKTSKVFFVVKWNVHPGLKRPSNRTSALWKRVHREHANAMLGQESRLMLKQMLHADSSPAATPWSSEYFQSKGSLERSRFVVRAFYSLGYLEIPGAKWWLHSEARLLS